MIKKIIGIFLLILSGFCIITILSSTIIILNKESFHQSIIKTTFESKGITLNDAEIENFSKDYKRAMHISIGLYIFLGLVFSYLGFKLLKIRLFSFSSKRAIK